jgi:hypothetical protein
MLQGIELSIIGLEAVFLRLMAHPRNDIGHRRLLRYTSF